MESFEELKPDMTVVGLFSDEEVTIVRVQVSRGSHAKVAYKKQDGVIESKTKVGHEFNFNRYIYKYTPPRPLDEIETDLKRIEGEIADMLAEVTE